MSSLGLLEDKSKEKKMGKKSFTKSKTNFPILGAYKEFKKFKFLISFLAIVLWRFQMFRKNIHFKVPWFCTRPNTPIFWTSTH